MFSFPKRSLLDRQKEEVDRVQLRVSFERQIYIVIYSFITHRDIYNLQSINLFEGTHSRVCMWGGGMCVYTYVYMYMCGRELVFALFQCL